MQRPPGHEVHTVLAVLEKFEGVGDSAQLIATLNNATALVDMGFKVEKVLDALGQCNNDINRAAMNLSSSAK